MPLKPKVVRGVASLARRGIGSPTDLPYVAPELAGEEPGDPARTDLYALGTLVMRMLMNHPEHP